MTVVTEEPQHMTALLSGNHLRIERAAWRRLLKAMPWEEACMYFCVLLHEPPDWALNMRLTYAVEGLPWVRQTRAEMLCRRIQVNYDKRMGQLTDRQCTQIAEILPTVRCHSLGKVA